MSFKRVVLNIVILFFGVLMVLGSCPFDCPPDDNIPIITLNGESSITLMHGTPYIEIGATATDEEDGEIKVALQYLP